MVREAQNRCLQRRKPYPCGYYGDSKHNCRCTPLQIQNYRNKISLLRHDGYGGQAGPLLDRIDIHINNNRDGWQKTTQAGAAATECFNHKERRDRKDKKFYISLSHPWQKNLPFSVLYAFFAVNIALPVL